MNRTSFVRAAAFAAAALLASAGVVTATGTAGGNSASAAVAPAPIRAAFYYPWFPETQNWASQYIPALGKYDSGNATIKASHIAMAKYAGLDAFIASWWGQGTPTDTRLPGLLSAANAQSFKITPYYEKEGNNTPPTDAEFGSDLTYLKTLAGSPAWLKVNGKPVLFIYNALASESTCATVQRLESINAGRFYLNMKVFAGYTQCAVQPESWHQYGPSTHYDQQGTYSSTVSPGFFKYNEATPRLARDVTRFTADLNTQVNSGAQWQLTVSFNEWGEGTALEPADPWQSPSGFGDYLDAMKTVYGQPVVPPTTTPTTPTQPPNPTATDVADAYVSNATGSADTNFGTDPLLIANATNSVTSHIKFHVTDSTATSATLKVYSTVSGTTPTKVYTEPNTWTETGITFTNQPTAGALLGSLSPLVANAYSTLAVPINGSGDYSFELVTGATANRNMQSREGANAPQLVLDDPVLPTTTASTPPTTPPTSTTPTTSTSPTSTTTTTTTQPPTNNITKTLVIIEENHSLAQMQAGMPYLYSQAQKYGYATNYTGIRHPSEPNYLAIAGGSTFGVTDDGSPTVNGPKVGNATSVFGAAIAAGKTAKTYADSMTSNCPSASSQGRYVAKHNPWVYFQSATEAAACAANDVPAGSTTSGNLLNDINAGTLPNVGMLVPNLDNDGHDGGSAALPTADAYLQAWLPKIYAGPDFQSGHLAVIVTADEDDSASGNVVLTTVLHPSQNHNVVTSALNHYSLTKFLTDVAGAPCILAGCQASNFATAFGLTL